MMRFPFFGTRRKRQTRQAMPPSSKPRLERLEDRVNPSWLTNPAPSVTQVGPDTYLLRKELYGYGNYGVADRAADVLYSREAGSWSYDLTSLLGGNRRVSSAEFTISGVLDDHYDVTGSYFGTIGTNGVTQFSGAFPYAHGAPYGQVFNNWSTQVVPVTDTRPSTFTIAMANNSNLGGGDWIAMDSITLRVVLAPVAPYLEISVDAGPAFSITAEPSMPDIRSHVRVVGVTPDPTASTSFSWTTAVNYRAPANSGGRDMSYSVSQTVVGGDYTPQFAKIRGGDLSFTVTATVGGQSVSASLDSLGGQKLTIVGTNPNPAAVYAYINGKQTPVIYPSGSQYDYHKVLRQIVQQESTVLQFLGGQPYWTEDRNGGAGLFQVTPATKDDWVWDWRANINEGVSVFSMKLDEAVSYAARTATRLRNELNALRASLGLTQLTLAPFTPDMVVRETIQRYNSGTNYTPRRDSNRKLHVDIQGTIGVVPWDEVGNGYVDAVLRKPG